MQTLTSLDLTRLSNAAVCSSVHATFHAVLITILRQSENIPIQRDTFELLLLIIFWTKIKNFTHPSEVKVRLIMTTYPIIHHLKQNEPSSCVFPVKFGL